MLDKIKGFLSSAKDKVVSFGSNIARNIQAPTQETYSASIRTEPGRLSQSPFVRGARKVFDFFTEANLSDVNRDFGEGRIQRTRGEQLALQSKQNDEFVNALFSDNKQDLDSLDLFGTKDANLQKSLVAQGFTNVASIFNMYQAAKRTPLFTIGDSGNTYSERFQEKYKERQGLTDIVRNVDVFGYEPFKFSSEKEFAQSEGAIKFLNIAGLVVPSGPAGKAAEKVSSAAEKAILNGLDDVTEETVSAAAIATERVNQFSKGAGKELSSQQQAHIKNQFLEEFSGIVDNAEYFSKSDVFNSSVKRMSEDIPSDQGIIEKLITTEKAAKKTADAKIAEFQNSAEFKMFEVEQSAFIDNSGLQKDLVNAFSNDRVLSYTNDDIPSISAFTRADGSLGVGKKIPSGAKEVTPITELAEKAGEDAVTFFNKYRGAVERIAELSPKKRMFEQLMKDAEFRAAVRTRQINQLTSQQIAKSSGGRLALEVKKARAQKNIEKKRIIENAQRNLRAAKDKLAQTKSKSKFDRNISKAELFVQTRRAASEGVEKGVLRGMKVGTDVGKKLGIKKVISRVAELQSYKGLFVGDVDGQAKINQLIGEALSDGGRNLLDPYFSKLVKHIELEVESIIDRRIRTDMVMEYEENVGKVISDAAEKILDKDIVDFTNKELDDLIVAYERVSSNGEQLLPREVIYAYSNGKKNIKIPDLVLTDAQRMARLEKNLSGGRGRIMSVEKFNELFFSGDAAKSAKNFVKAFKTTKGKTASASLYQSPVKAALSYAAEDARSLAYFARKKLQVVNRRIYSEARKKAISSGYAKRSDFLKDITETGDLVKRSIKNYLTGNSSTKLAIEKEWIQYGIEKEMMKAVRHLEAVYAVKKEALKASNLLDRFKQNYSHAIVDEALSSATKSFKRGEYKSAAGTALRGQQSGLSYVFRDDSLKDGFAGFSLDKKSFQYEANFNKFIDYSDDPFDSIEKYVEESEMLLYANKYSGLMEDLYATSKQIEVDMKAAGLNSKVIANAFSGLENFFRFNVENASLEKTFGRSISQDSGFYTATNATMKIARLFAFFGNPGSLASIYTGEVLGTSLPRVVASVLKHPIRNAKYYLGFNNMENLVKINRELNNSSTQGIVDWMSNIVTLGKTDVLENFNRPNFSPDKINDAGMLPLSLGVAKSHASVATAHILNTHMDAVERARDLIKLGKTEEEIFLDPVVFNALSDVRITMGQLVDRLSSVRSAAGDEILSKAATMFQTWAIAVINGTFQAAKFQATKLTSNQWDKSTRLYRDTNKISADTAIYGLAGILTTYYASKNVSGYVENRTDKLSKLIKNSIQNSHGVWGVINSVTNNRQGKVIVDAALGLFPAVSLWTNTFTAGKDAVFLFREGGDAGAAVKSFFSNAVLQRIQALKYFGLVDVKKTAKQFDMSDSLDMIMAKATTLSNDMESGKIQQEEYDAAMTKAIDDISSEKKYTEDDRELLETYFIMKASGEDLENYPQLFGSQDFSAAGVAYANYKALAAVTDPEERERRKGIVERIILRDVDKSEGNKKLEKFQLLYQYMTDPEYTNKKDRENIDKIMAVYSKNRSVKREQVVNFVTYGLKGLSADEANQRIESSMDFINLFIEPNEEESEYINDLLLETLVDIGFRVEAGD